MKVYSLKKEIPEEISIALAKAIDDRDYEAEQIRKHTHLWVKHLKKIIELNEVCERLTRKSEQK